MEKCRVTGVIVDASGAALVGASIKFTLTRREKDGATTILPAPVTSRLDEAGNVSVDLWPNARGNAGTIYMVKVEVPGPNNSVTIYQSWKAVVPEAPTASLTDISELVPPASVDDARAAVILAQQAATESANSALATADDRRQTGEDRIATGQDTEATAADRIATGADRAATGADRQQTGLDRISTALDAEATADDRRQTGEDLVATTDDRRQTGEDRVATGEDRAQTGVDKAATAADRVATGQDRAQTGLDRAATAADALSSAAARDDAQAAAIAAEVAKIVWRGSYAPATAYAARDAVSYGNSSWIAKAATTGNAPPSLPTTENTWWQLMASKGDAYETYGVSIYRAAGIGLGGYYAERSASASSTQSKLLAEIIAGNVGAEVDFYVEVNGAMAYGPLTLAIGTPVSLSGLAISVPAGARVSFVITRMTGNVTEFFAKTYGAL